MPADKKASSLARIVAAGTVGTAIEFYDFVVYAFLATYFAAQFFPSSDPVAGLLASYAALAIGMIMRPVGGAMFGVMSDKLNRRFALQLSVIMIALPTFIIGVLPTYQQIGVIASILLIALRMIQGLSVGGEYPNSIVYIVEHAKPAQRGFWGSFSPMGAFSGLILGTIMSMAVGSALGAEQMAAWGWRVPFLASAALTLIGVVVRMGLSADRKPDTTVMPERLLLHAFRTHWREMCLLSLANTSTGIVTVVGFAYTASWMIEAAGVPRPHALAINLSGLVVLGILTLVGGAVADRLGKMRVLMAGAVVLLFGAWPAFLGMGSGNTPAQFLGMSILALGHGFFVGPMSAYMVARVPVIARATVVSIGYSVPVGILGGLGPLVSEYLLDRLGLHMAPAIVIMAGAFISLATLLAMGRWPYPDPLMEEDLKRRSDAASP